MSSLAGWLGNGLARRQRKRGLSFPGEKDVSAGRGLPSYPRINRGIAHTVVVGAGKDYMALNRPIALIWYLLLCYFMAFVARFWTRPGIPTWYAGLAKPAWRGPNWLFGPVWTILCGLMVVAAWRVWKAPAPSGETWR